MNNITHYTPFSSQRYELRKAWNEQYETGNKDWEKYLLDAELLHHKNSKLKD